MGLQYRIARVPCVGEREEVLLRKIMPVPPLRPSVATRTSKRAKDVGECRNHPQTTCLVRRCRGGVQVLQHSRSSADPQKHGATNVSPNVARSSPRQEPSSARCRPSHAYRESEGCRKIQGHLASGCRRREHPQTPTNGNTAWSRSRRSRRQSQRRIVLRSMSWMRRHFNECGRRRLCKVELHARLARHLLD